jgi:hypothetical protein
MIYGLSQYLVIENRAFLLVDGFSDTIAEKKARAWKLDIKIFKPIH